MGRLSIDSRVATACVLAAFVCFVPRPVESQVQGGGSAEWDPAAAARYLDTRLDWWTNWPGAARDHDTSCVSCHTALPYALARPALRSLLGESGPRGPEAKLLADVTKRAEMWNDVQAYYPDQRFGLPKTSESRGTEAILNALILAYRDAYGGGLAADTRQAFENLWALQFTRGEDSGGWAWLFFDLAPWESDGADYFGAALAAVAVGVAPEGYALEPELEERLSLLKAYLLDPRQRSPLDRVMLLWASAELADLLPPETERSIIDELLRLQRDDGGWSLTALGHWERPNGFSTVEASDGYATGLIAFVLQRADLSPAHQNVRRALDWLIRNQDRASGHWPSSSLNRLRDPASERGRFMSDAATAFAVLALAEADPTRE